MVSQIRRGVLDFIGAARPSIADPFLPKKIEEGRLEDIRECIGCNICITGDMTATPIRCTQNPTMGEEWRKGWHPERIRRKESDKRVLVVGAGPAGLEAARALGQRGYEVSLAESSRELGGRVTLEARLPGLAEWARVRDWRIGQINKMPNVGVYRENHLTADDVLAFGAERVVLATGCVWRRDGYGRSNGLPIPGLDRKNVCTPDDVLRGALPEGPVLLFDDDAFYLGSALAELLQAAGRTVIYLTPDDVVASWTMNTQEYRHVQKRLRSLDVRIVTARNLVEFSGETAHVACVYTGEQEEIQCTSLLAITARLPQDELQQALLAREAEWRDAGVEAVDAVGDCLAPGLIAHAVYEGHRYAQALDAPAEGDVRFKRTLRRDWRW
jgi:dimethylamine/trimethylamine dehydrogenase